VTKLHILGTYFKMKELTATLSIERELDDEFRIIEYRVGNGEVHFHSQIEICIVEEGSIEALVNNSKTTLEKGDVAVSLSYDSHRYFSKGDVKYCVMLLPSNICEKFHAMLNNKSIATPFICHSIHRDLFLEYLTWIKKGEINELTRLGYLYLILGLIKEEILDVVNSYDTDSELLSALLLYIHKNYSKNLTLSSIAKAFGYHPGYISSYFKSHLDIGISRYINIIRLKNAVFLMHQNKYTVTQIALECGFCSTRTFYRAFHTEFGCSPKEYISKQD